MSVFGPEYASAFKPIIQELLIDELKNFTPEISGEPIWFWEMRSKGVAPLLFPAPLS
jgi:hypothetical protein